MDTMVKPMMIGDMPRLAASAAAPAMNTSALQMRIRKPITMAAVANSINMQILLKYLALTTMELQLAPRCQKSHRPAVPGFGCAVYRAPAGM